VPFCHLPLLRADLFSDVLHGYQETEEKEKSYEKNYEKSYLFGGCESNFSFDGNDGLCPQAKNDHHL